MRQFLLSLTSLLPGFIAKSIYRIMGYKIGKKVHIGFFTIIDISQSAILEDGVRISSFVYVKANQFNMQSYSRIKQFIYINTPYVSIGRDSLISNFVIIRSGHPSAASVLKIGDLVHIFPFVTIDCSSRVSIGDETGVGPKCDIFTHAAYKSMLEGYPVTYADVNIGKRVELTYRVFVAPGVNIGDDAICAYGSYVNKDIPAGVLAAGLPAVVKRDKEQIAVKLSIMAKRTALEKVITDYKKDIGFINKRAPLDVVIITDNSTDMNIEGRAYLFLDNRPGKITVSKYCLFVIEDQICYNHGLDKKDFLFFRRYLSRYGIRFRYANEQEL